MVSRTCLAVSACVSRSTQTAVSFDQVSATSAILTQIGLAVVNICEKMFAKMNVSYFVFILFHIISVSGRFALMNILYIINLY